MQRYRRFLPCFVLVGAWGLFFWRFAAPSSGDRVTYPPGDFSQQFGVFRDVAYRAFTAGRMPLWADCLWSGYPFHADPQAQVFYPPLWLIMGFLRVMGWGHFPIEALVAEVAVHYLFLSLFLYLFLRSISLRPSAATLGALVFTYGCYLTGSPPLQTATLEVDTWLPLALLFAGRLAARRNARELALTALMLALAFLAGHPQTFAYVALLTLTYFAFRARQAGWGYQALVRSTGALIGLTGTLAAVQLLPSAHFVLNSTRVSVAFEQAGHGFPFEDVLQFLLTGFVSYWHPLYVGILPLGLAVFSLPRRSAEVRFWAGAALVSLILSFGSRGIAYDVAYWVIQGFRLFRSQERLALVVSFSLAVLAAFGAHGILAALTRPARRSLNRLVRAAGMLCVASFVLLGFLTYIARFDSDPGDWRRISNGAGVLVFAAGLTLVALALRARVPTLRRWLPAVFVTVVILDLFAANRPVNVVSVFEPFAHNPLLDSMHAEPAFFRVQDDSQLPGHAGCVYGYRAIEGVTPYQVATYARFLERAPETVRWQLLGVKYVVTWRAGLYDASGQNIPGEVVARGTIPDEKGNVSTIHRLALEPRRAFLVHQVEVASGDDALYARLGEPRFDPFSTVVAPSSVEVSLDGRGDSVIVVSDAPGRLRVSTASNSDAVLVANEAYFPGWRVRIEGQPADLFRADGALLGVSLPSGAHSVEFVYQPGALVWGGVMSALALLPTLGLLVLDRPLRKLVG